MKFKDYLRFVNKFFLNVFKNEFNWILLDMFSLNANRSENTPFIPKMSIQVLSAAATQFATKAEYFHEYFFIVFSKSFNISYKFRN